MVKSQNQNAGRRHSTKIYNRSFERVEEFKVLQITLTNQNSIQVKITAHCSQGLLAVIR